MNSDIINFDLRGDELEIIEAIKKYVPTDREDIWSWLCYLQGEVENKKKIDAIPKTSCEFCGADSTFDFSNHLRIVHGWTEEQISQYYVDKAKEVIRKETE